MKSFFNEYEAAYGEDANDLTQAVRDAIEPIVHKYVAYGYPRREIEYLILRDVNCLLSEIILRNAMDMCKKEGIPNG